MPRLHPRPKSHRHRQPKASKKWFTGRLGQRHPEASDLNLKPRDEPEFSGHRGVFLDINRLVSWILSKVYYGRVIIGPGRR